MSTISATLQQRLASPSRLAALRATGLLDAGPDEVLDRLARFATRVLGVPTVSITLVDDRRQLSAGRADRVGPTPASRESALAYSYCQHVVATGAPLVVAHAGDHPLLRENLGFTELGVVAYAGVPLTTAAGETLGSLCAMGPTARSWSDEDVDTLRDLARAAMSELELRIAVGALTESRDALLASEERLRRLASHDELTGLLNRRGFIEHARQQLAVSTRARTPLHLLALDLDGLKEINDQLGHEAGDAALVEMADVLSRTMRVADVVARMGGDEFVILAASPHTDVDGLLARLHAAIAACNARPGRAYRLATSAGVAAFDPAAPTTLAELLRAADEAMYADKRWRRAATPRVA
ncbi:MAG: diguanylate cyclase [Gemmatirosa sp.]